MDHRNLIPGHYYLQPKKVTLKLSPTKPEKSVWKNNFPVTPKITRSRKHPIQHNTVNKKRTPTNQEIKMRQMEQAIVDSKCKLKGLQKNTHYCIPNRMQFPPKQHGQTYKALASSLSLSRHQHHPMGDTLSPQPNWPKTPSTPEITLRHSIQDHAQPTDNWKQNTAHTQHGSRKGKMPALQPGQHNQTPIPGMPNGPNSKDIPSKGTWSSPKRAPKYPK